MLLTNIPRIPPKTAWISVLMQFSSSLMVLRLFACTRSFRYNHRKVLVRPMGHSLPSNLEIRFLWNFSHKYATQFLVEQKQFVHFSIKASQNILKVVRIKMESSSLEQPVFVPFVHMSKTNNFLTCERKEHWFRDMDVWNCSWGLLIISRGGSWRIGCLWTITASSKNSRTIKELKFKLFYVK